jgi:hypothetical protein
MISFVMNGLIQRTLNNSSQFNHRLHSFPDFAAGAGLGNDGHLQIIAGQSNKGLKTDAAAVPGNPLPSQR